MISTSTILELCWGFNVLVFHSMTEKGTGKITKLKVVISNNNKTIRVYCSIHADENESHTQLLEENGTIMDGIN